jgi:ferredoxin--NADP+ reductase
MSTLREETVLGVRHWDERVFSFTTTRAPGLRFENGQFVMLGLEVGGRPLLRAYSIVSPTHEDFLEFLSIKVPDGPLTSRLQHIKPGDRVLVGTKPTGTLLVDDLKPGRNLFLLATGTGLAPFMSIVQDPATYERFDQVVLAHGVRFVSELAYRDHILHDLPRHEFLRELVRDKLRYYPTVTREDFKHVGRLTTLLDSGRLLEDLGLPALDPALDRAMVCGSPTMLKDISKLLDAAGFHISPGIGEAGDYVVEKSFAMR